MVRQQVKHKAPQAMFTTNRFEAVMRIVDIGQAGEYSAS